MIDLFEERLRQLRKRKGYTQLEMATNIGLTRGQIANYEQGKREPSFETLIKIADFFGVSLDYLLGRDDIYMSWNDTIEKAREYGISAQELMPILEIMKHTKT